MQQIRVWLDQETYVRLVNSSFDEDRTIPTQAAELVKRGLDATLPPSAAPVSPSDARALARVEA